MTAIAALLLVAVIAAEGWTDGSDSATTDSGTRIVMVGGVAVEVEDDATFGAASAGAMNGGATDADADSGAAQSSRSSTDWFNWWRPFELVLGLTVAALVVTMMSRRRPRRE